jgi:hypothetical protein
MDLSGSQAGCQTILIIPEKQRFIKRRNWACQQPGRLAQAQAGRGRFYAVLKKFIMPKKIITLFSENA